MECQLIASLHSACRLGELTQVKLLVLDMNVDINGKNILGMTPLMSAALAQKMYIVLWLLDNGADVNETDYELNSVLHLLIKDYFVQQYTYFLDDNSTNYNEQERKDSLLRMCFLLHSYEIDLSIVNLEGHTIMYYIHKYNLGFLEEYFRNKV